MKVLVPLRPLSVRVNKTPITLPSADKEECPRLPLCLEWVECQVVGCQHGASSEAACTTPEPSFWGLFPVPTTQDERCPMPRMIVQNGFVTQTDLMQVNIERQTGTFPTLREQEVVAFNVGGSLITVENDPFPSQNSQELQAKLMGKSEHGLTGRGGCHTERTSCVTLHPVSPLFIPSDWVEGT